MTSPAPAAPPTTPPRRGLRAGLVVAALAIVLAVGGVVWFLGGDAPDEVDIASAAAQVAATTEPDAGATEPDAGATEPDAGADPEATDTGEDAVADDAAPGTSDGGTWAIDPTIGTFSVTESTGTFVGVRVAEVLASIGETTAVVRTPEVSGGVELDGTTLTAATFEADFTALVSDESRRENAIQRALNTDVHPTAVFVLTEPVDLGAMPTADAPVAVTASGDLTVNGVTNPVEVPLEVAVVDGVAVITGAFDVTFSDYGVQAPTAPIVVSVEDTGTVELQLFLTEA